MKMNREFYLDRVRACFLGKNIGGTMGAPYEGQREMQNIDGYNSPKGEPLPNDDLDLQLVWLAALEARGVRGVDASVLAEYWISGVPPHWNEYGIGKGNLARGVFPPYSGEYHNEKWKHSNGAWIRTELWATLFPGYPEAAVHYAYMDAIVDHGHGEGTPAAIFVAALESMAFFETDIRKLIDRALTFIEEDSRVARCVRMAVSLYDEGKSLADARNAIVSECADLGWFQAPANVAFVILGLLYGEGDYKKSMLAAINCGDDTDCTGATIGSIMGLMGGTACVPPDWAEYIGDRIVTAATNASMYYLPKSCTELTQRIYELMPSAMKSFGAYTEYTDGATDGEVTVSPILARHKDILFPRMHSGYCVPMPDMVFARGSAEVSRICVAKGDTVTLTVRFENMVSDCYLMSVEIKVPEGFSADATEKGIHLDEWHNRRVGEAVFTLTAEEAPKLDNVIEIKARVQGRVHVSYAEVHLFNS